MGLLTRPDKLLQRTTRRLGSQATARKRLQKQLRIEQLEDRRLLAVVAAWNAEGNALDSVGSNNGTLFNGATYATGQVGKAFKFDGINDRINIADSPSLALTHSMTIEGWVKANAIPAAGQQGEILFRGDDRGGLDPYSLSLQPNGQLRFEVVSGPGSTNLWATMPIGQFVHVVGTLDDATGQMNLYLNGGLISQTVTTVRPFGALDPASNPGIGIGNHGGYPTTPHNFPFNGLIDELKVYDNALTASDVVANFFAGGGKPSISISDVSLSEDASVIVGTPLVPANSSGLVGTRSILLGPDGNVYVASFDTDSIKVFASGTGEYIRELTTPGGEMDAPIGMAIGQDGKLYVGARYSRNIVRFDISTGDSQVFVPTAAGGLGRGVSLAFGPDGNLYVSTRVDDDPAATNSVKRFDGNTGAFLDDFVASGSGGLTDVYGIAFGPDGNLYVVSAASSEIKRYDGQTGAYLNNFVASGIGGIANASQILFHSDGNLYVASQANQQILRYNAATGQFLDAYASSLGAGPTGLAFAPSGELYVALGNAVGQIVPLSAAVTVSLSVSSANTITVNYSTTNGTAVAGSDYTATSGVIVFPPGVTKQTLGVQLIDDTLLESTEVYTINLSNPSSGATLADNQAVVTIIDDEAGRALSISDTTMNEGGTPHFRQVFVPRTNGGLVNPRTPIFHNGMLYVLNESANSVIRYNAETGAFVDYLIGPNPLLNGGLARPMSMAFGPEGNLYIVTYETNQVLRYDGTTGAFLDTFISSGSGGLSLGTDLAFDSAGNLYVTTDVTAQVLRYDTNGNPFPGSLGASGTAVFVPSNSGGMAGGRGIIFDASGNLLVASIGTDQVLKFSGTTGAFLGQFVSTGSGGLDQPHSLAIGPDGNLYVGSTNLDAVFRYSGTSGAFIDTFVLPGSGGLDNPIGLTFDSTGRLYVASAFSREILQFSIEPEAVFTVSLPGALTTPISVNFATASGSAVSGNDFVITSGTITIAPGKSFQTIVVPLIDDSIYEDTESFFVNLSNPVGGTIAIGQGVATIIDNDLPPTKFFVVNDGSPDRTYEYSATGSAIENYAINSGNTQPRGAASNVAGDKVWVADKNRKVYVYNTSGGLQGSWSAGSLASNALVEGIATNGSDVWIVDSKSDKVFRYTNAAGKLTGSQNAASSFPLSSSNTYPKGIVTDGTYLWVVNDSTTDKVFKYTTSGSLVGSWTINTANKYPTGLTIDPTGASQSIWIVDSGTDRVYEYGNARSNSGGSLVGSFGLAAGNTNPQGIADPPTPGTQLQSASANLTYAPMSLAPDFDESTPLVTAFASANLRTSDSRSDERAARVDQALVMPGSPKLKLRDSNVSAVPPVRSEPMARADKDDAREACDEALLDVLAEADLAHYASVFGN